MAGRRRSSRRSSSSWDPSKRDPYFYLGNTMAHSHSFMIVGLFHPPIAKVATKKGADPRTPMLPGIDQRVAHHSARVPTLKTVGDDRAVALAGFGLDA